MHVVRVAASSNTFTLYRWCTMYTCCVEQQCFACFGLCCRFAEMQSAQQTHTQPDWSAIFIFAQHAMDAPSPRAIHSCEWQNATRHTTLYAMQYFIYVTYFDVRMQCIHSEHFLILCNFAVESLYMQCFEFCHVANARRNGSNKWKDRLLTAFVRKSSSQI